MDRKPASAKLQRRARKAAKQARTVARIAEREINRRDARTMIGFDGATGGDASALVIAEAQLYVADASMRIVKVYRDEEDES